MKRKFFTTCVMLSLLACALTGWWWSGSGSRIDELTYERHGVQTVQLKGSSGKVMLSRTAYSSGERGNLRQVSFNSSPLDSKGSSELQNVMAFSYKSEPLARNSGSVSTLILPAWMLTGAFALMPSIWFARKLKPKKQPKPAA
jgi:hypothetical protein